MDETKIEINKYISEKKGKKKRKKGWGEKEKVAIYTPRKNMSVFLQPHWQFRHGKITEGRSSLSEQEKDVSNNCVICPQISRDKNRLICSKVSRVTE